MTISRLITGSIWVVSVLAVNITVPAQKKRETLPPQWEHAVTYGCESQPFQGGKSNLQEMGEYGWELAGVSKDSTGNSTCYFKRPKREGGYPEPPKQAEPTATAPKCSLTVAQAPAIRGLRLGMSVDDVLAAFPGSKYDENLQRQLKEAETERALGQASLSLFPVNYPEAKEKFAGISNLSFIAFDRKIVEIKATYFLPQPADWSVQMLTAKFIETFGLPSLGAWTTQSSGSNLRCAEFEVQVWNNYWSVDFRLGAPFYREQIGQRQRALYERKRQEFKP